MEDGEPRPYFAGFTSEGCNRCHTWEIEQDEEHERERRERSDRPEGERRERRDRRDRDEAVNYNDNGKATTSLGDLLSNIKLGE